MKLNKIFFSFAVATAMASCCNGGSCPKGESADSSKVSADTVKKAGCCIKGDWNIISANGVCAKLDTVFPFVSFLDSCKVNGNSGVNTFNGGYKKDGEALSFSELAQTKMMGSEAEMKVEDAVTDALNKTASVKVCGDSAKFFNADGQEIMVLVKKN